MNVLHGKAHGYTVTSGEKDPLRLSTRTFADISSPRAAVACALLAQGSEKIRNRHCGALRDRRMLRHVPSSALQSVKKGRWRDDRARAEGQRSGSEDEVTKQPRREVAMLRTAGELKGVTIEAMDGDIGSVQDLYFDDQTWTVRYLVVDTGTWLPGRQVLISPFAFQAVPGALTPADVADEEAGAEPPDDRRRSPRQPAAGDRVFGVLRVSALLGRTRPLGRPRVPGGAAAAEQGRPGDAGARARKRGSEPSERPGRDGLLHPRDRR